MVLYVHAGVKALKDEETLEKIGIKDDGVLYFKDLGPQLGWTTVSHLLLLLLLFILLTAHTIPSHRYSCVNTLALY